MWTALLVAYVVGALVTLFDLQSRVFKREWLLAGGFALLWPAYWIYCLWSFLRKRGPR